MVTPAQFTIFVSTGNVMLGQAYSECESFYDKIASTIPSGTSQEIYGWTGMLPKPRLWLGPRVVNEANPQTYTVPNYPWETTLSIDRFRLDDDAGTYGVFYRQLPDLARQAKRLPDLWMRDLIENINTQTGAPQIGLDGLTFWNTAHLQNFYAPSGATYCNDFTGGGVTKNGILVGGALSPTAFATLYEYMRQLKAEDGEAMDIRPTMMMVPTTLETEAQLIIKSTMFAPPAWATVTGQVGAADNPFLRFGVDYFVNPLLSSATKWYLLDLTKSIKPFIWQQREAARLAVRTNEEDPEVFDAHRYLWGYWGRGAPAWSFPWLAARSGP